MRGSFQATTFNGGTSSVDYSACHTTLYAAVQRAYVNVPRAGLYEARQINYCARLYYLVKTMRGALQANFQRCPDERTRLLGLAGPRRRILTFAPWKEIYLSVPATRDFGKSPMAIPYGDQRGKNRLALEEQSY